MRSSNSTFRPQLLALDNRSVPSASIVAIGNTLSIRADNIASFISIRDDGKGDINATVKSANETVSSVNAHINRIAIVGSPGNDTVDFRLTAAMHSHLALDMNLGAGNDHAYMDFYAGIVDTSLSVKLLGGAGNDSVDAQFGKLTNASVDYRASLGDGADSSTVALFNGASGHTHANFDVAGNSGSDHVNFIATGTIDAAARVTFHAENQADANDRLTARYRGELDGTLKVIVDKAAAKYGVQSYFLLDPASTGTLIAIVRDNSGTCGSTLRVTDHSDGAIRSDIDRLDHCLTEPDGARVTHFDPAWI